MILKEREYTVDWLADAYENKFKTISEHSLR